MSAEVLALIALTVLAALFGLALVVLFALTITAASQSRRLRAVRRQMHQLSSFVQQLAQAIDELRQSQGGNLASAPVDSALARVAGEKTSDGVQSADRRDDPQEQPKAPQGAVVAEASKRREIEYGEKCRHCAQTINLRSLDEVLHHDKPGHRPLTDAELTALTDANAH